MNVFQINSKWKIEMCLENAKSIILNRFLHRVASDPRNDNKNDCMHIKEIRF